MDSRMNRPKAGGQIMNELSQIKWYLFALNTKKQ